MCVCVSPELKISPESPNLNITGLGEEINAANKVIFTISTCIKTTESGSR